MSAETAKTKLRQPRDLFPFRLYDDTRRCCWGRYYYTWENVIFELGDRGRNIL
jgi:hypothetical protein